MKRYISSFFLTFLIYTLAFVGIFYFSTNELLVQKKEETKRVSLNHLIIKKEPIKQIKKVVKPKPKKIVKVEEVKQKKSEEIQKIVASKKQVQEKPLEKIVSKVSYQEEFLRKHLIQIKKYIQSHVKYSKRARRLNIQGSVVVQFELLTDGSIKNMKAISGHRLLKKSTIKAIETASSYFPKVNKSVLIKVPIDYKLI